ncbi:PepSY domain-containing protein [Shewanella sp. 10N.286.54.B9]|uniref:PepSY domain-containing protein n=1 Tax=Shewanella sp. 10N.286.54.B9 TaxID=3229719 RepID=UPI00354C10DC
MQTRSVRRWIRVLHYWLGVIVSLQLLIWLITGVYFNLTPHDELKGMVYNHSHHIAPTALKITPERLLSAEEVLSLFPNNTVEQLKLQMLAEQPVYLLDEQVQRYQHECQQQSLRHAYTGKPFVIDKQIAMQLAIESYMGPGEVASINKLTLSPDWPKQCNPMWQVNMADDLSTRIYINAVNGQLVGHKNQQTELADLMFKLHFMDYLNQGSFNNPFSWLLAVLMVLLSLSGLYWVIESLLLRRYWPRFLVNINEKRVRKSC